MAPKLTTKQWVLSKLILALVLSLALYQFFGLKQNLQISFLDVGQGDSILIQTEEYKNILIDSGPDGKVVEELGKKLGFFNQQIDLFILTHPDLDHVGGILDIIQKYPVKQIMLTGTVSSNQIYQTLLTKIQDEKIPVIYPHNDIDYQIGENAYLDILYPFEGQNLIGQKAKNVNDTSISLILRNGAREPLALLTGDAEEDQERDMLLSGQSFQANLFKLGHHGSRTSSTASFLSAIRPKEVVITAGRDNKFNHPHEETLERISDLKTHYTWDGAVDFELW